MEEHIERPQPQFTAQQVTYLVEQFGNLAVERGKNRVYVQAGNLHKQAGETFAEAVNVLYDWVRTGGQFEQVGV